MLSNRRLVVCGGRTRQSLVVSVACVSALLMTSAVWGQRAEKPTPDWQSRGSAITEGVLPEGEWPATGFAGATDFGTPVSASPPVSGGQLSSGVVPEPSAVVLVIIGGVSVWLARRRTWR